MVAVVIPAGEGPAVTIEEQLRKDLTSACEAIDTYSEALNIERKNSQALQESLNKIIAVAHKHGWNGVENSKILHEFLDAALSHKNK